MVKTGVQTAPQAGPNAMDHTAQQHAHNHTMVTFLQKLGCICCMIYSTHLTSSCLTYSTHLTSWCMTYSTHLTSWCMTYITHLKSWCMTFSTHLTS